MFKKLFTKLQKENSNFTKEELALFEPFEKDEIIIKISEGKYEINSKYKIAIVKVEKNIAILEDLLSEHKNIKLDKEDLSGAYDGDLVLAKRVFNPRSKTKAKIIKVLETKASNILVYVKDKAFYTVKDNVRLESKEAFKYKQDEVLLINSKSFGLVKKIGNIYDASIDEYISLFLYEETFRLEKPIKVEAKMDDENKRVDLRDLAFCTIDPNSAKDHDDAVYFDEKNEILYVAIADVSYFVKQNSELDKIAFKKSTSVYLPSKVLPMLPNELSEELCSLKEGVDRYAYVFKLYLDLENISVKKSELFEAIIKSQKKFSYGRIDRVLEGKFDQYSKLDKEIFDSLISLYEVTKSFRKKRLNKGYEFRSEENRLKLKNHKLVAIETESSTASHQLIEECMLLANIEASKSLETVGIFRIHEEPSFKAISKLVDDVNILGIEAKLQNDVHDTITHIQNKAKRAMLSQEVDELIIQAQTQAKYSSKNLGHFGLGFKSYSHFTSPIRRYSDLVLHRMLKTKKIPENIDEICEYISQNERKIDQLVWDFEDRKYARWAKDNIGESIKVKVVDTQRAKAVCYEKMIGLKVTLENYKGQKLFSKMSVVIKEVDVMTKEVIVSIK